MGLCEWFFFVCFFVFYIRVYLFAVTMQKNELGSYVLHSKGLLYTSSQTRVFKSRQIMVFKGMHIVAICLHKFFRESLNGQPVLLTKFYFFICIYQVHGLSFNGTVDVIYALPYLIQKGFARKGLLINYLFWLKKMSVLCVPMTMVFEWCIGRLWVRYR